MDTFVILKYFVDFAGEEKSLQQGFTFEVFIWLKADTAAQPISHFPSFFAAVSDTLIVLLVVPPRCIHHLQLV